MPLFPVWVVVLVHFTLQVVAHYNRRQHGLDSIVADVAVVRAHMDMNADASVAHRRHVVASNADLVAPLDVHGRMLIVTSTIHFLSGARDQLVALDRRAVAFKQVDSRPVELFEAVTPKDEPARHTLLPHFIPFERCQHVVDPDAPA